MNIFLVKKYYPLEQAKITYYPLGKAFEKQTKLSEDQEEKTNKSNSR